MTPTKVHLKDIEGYFKMSNRSSLLSELVAFLKENKKWWLLPIFFVFGFLAILLVVAQMVPAAAPFIYTLF